MSLFGSFKRELRLRRRPLSVRAAVAAIVASLIVGWRLLDAADIEIRHSVSEAIISLLVLTFLCELGCLLAIAFEQRNEPDREVVRR